MTLREYLAVPYLVEAEAVQDGAGGWLRRAGHPELPDCWAASPRIEATLRRLERRRVDVILDLFRRGAMPPAPRPPLRDADTEGLLLRHDLHAAVAPLLDRTVPTGGNPDAVA